MRLPDFPPAFWSTLFQLLIYALIYASGDPAGVAEFMDNLVALGTTIANALLMLGKLWQEYKRQPRARSVETDRSLLSRWFWG